MRATQSQLSATHSATQDQIAFTQEQMSAVEIENRQNEG